MSAPATTAEKEYTGGCHCARFRYAFTHAPFAQGETAVEACNCSICDAKGAIWALVPEDKFRLTKGALGELTLYEFHKRVYKHYFCPTCGVALVLGVPSKREVHVNVRATDGVDVGKLKVTVFDGKNLL